MSRGSSSARGRVGGPRGWLWQLRLAVARRHRLLAAGLMAGSVALVLSVVAPDPPPSVTVVVAGADLAGGTTVSAGEVREVAVPESAVPAAALREVGAVTGRVLAAPVRAGEVLTDVRLVGPALLAGYGDGLVAAPVRIADAESAGLLRPGDVVDVLAAEAAVEAGGGTASAGMARLVAAGVRVVVAPRSDDSALRGGNLGEGALVVLATTSETAARLASAAVTSRLSVTLLGG